MLNQLLTQNIHVKLPHSSPPVHQMSPCHKLNRKMRQNLRVSTMAVADVGVAAVVLTWL